MTNKKSLSQPLKLSGLWAALGVAAAALASMGSAALCLKTADPLSAAAPAAVLCVALGAFVAAAGACKSCKSFTGGLGAGVAFLAVMVVASLCMENAVSSPWPYLAAVAGVLLGTLTAHGRKPSTAKRMKRYLNKR